MSVHFGSHGRRRAAVAVVAVAVAVALLLAYTIISTRKATDDVIANVSEVYLGELSEAAGLPFDTGVENKFSQLETVASGLEMAAPESREQTVDYLQAQAGNDDYAFLAVRTASGEFVSADGEVRPCDGDGGELPAYYDAQGRRVVLYDDKIVLVDDIEPLRCGYDTIVAAVCGFSSLGVGDRLNLTLFDGFSRSIMIDRDGMCVVSDRNSGLDSGESLFALIDERGSFVGGSSEEERIRSVLAEAAAPSTCPSCSTAAASTCTSIRSDMRNGTCAPSCPTASSRATSATSAALSPRTPPSWARPCCFSCC